MANDLAVVTPTFNERESIVSLIDRVLAACAPVSSRLRVVVVDDSSPDGTGAVVERRFQGDARVVVLRRPHKRGLGAAYLDALPRCIEQGFATIATLDADLSHPPELLPEMIRRCDEQDLVIGSRYTQGGAAPGLSRPRQALSMCTNAAWRLLGGGSSARDLTSGFRCYRAHALAQVLSRRTFSVDYAFLSEVAVELLRGGFKVAEVPITFAPRRGGASKLSVKTGIDSAAAFFRTWRRYGFAR